MVGARRAHAAVRLDGARRGADDVVAARQVEAESADHDGELVSELGLVGAREKCVGTGAAACASCAPCRCLSGASIRASDGSAAAASHVNAFVSPAPRSPTKNTQRNVTSETLKSRLVPPRAADAISARGSWSFGRAPYIQRPDQ